MKSTLFNFSNRPPKDLWKDNDFARAACGYISACSGGGGGISMGDAIPGATVNNGILIQNGGALAQNSSFYIVTSGTQGMVMGNATFVGPAAPQTYTLPAQSGTIVLTSDIGGFTVGSSVTSGTDNRIFYQASGLIAQSANLTFNGTTLTTANNASIGGISVGQGNVPALLNTAIGIQALNSITTGANQVAVGWHALKNVTTSGVLGTPGGNIGIGVNAGLALTTGDLNIAIGTSALGSALASTVSNVAIGYLAMQFAQGARNTGVGFNALKGASFSGSLNTAYGYSAGQAITTGNYNNILGFLGGITTGSSNIIINTSADGGTWGGTNLTTGSYNVFIGGYAGANLSNAVVLSDGQGNIVWSNQVSLVDYGTTTTLTANDGTYDIEVGSGGSGATTINLPTGTSASVGTVYIIKDLGANCSGNNITLDAGASNSNQIVGTSSARTLVMSTNGLCVRLKKVSATQWAVQ